MKYRSLRAVCASAVLLYSSVSSAGVICEQGPVYNDMVSNLSINIGDATVSWTEYDNVVSCQAPTGTLTTNNYGIDTGVGSILTTGVTASFVNTNTLSANSANIVGTATIGTGNITTANIGTGNITTANIGTGNITTANVGTGNITTANITTANVGTVNASGMINANGGLNMNGNVITNVAAGVADTDAVNVSQLNTVQGQVDRLSNDYNEFKGDTRRGIAAVTALTMIPDTLPGKSGSIGIGVGQYGGSSAVSIGGNLVVPNTDMQIKAGAAFSGSEATLGAGLGWSF